jgi:hypothetical protein
VHGLGPRELAAGGPGAARGPVTRTYAVMLSVRRQTLVRVVCNDIRSAAPPHTAPSTQPKPPTVTSESVSPSFALHSHNSFQLRWADSDSALCPQPMLSRWCPESRAATARTTGPAGRDAVRAPQMLAAEGTARAGAAEAAPERAEAVRASCSTSEAWSTASVKEAGTPHAIRATPDRVPRATRTPCTRSIRLAALPKGP